MSENKKTAYKGISPQFETMVSDFLFQEKQNLLSVPENKTKDELKALVFSKIQNAKPSKQISIHYLRVAAAAILFLMLSTSLGIQYSKWEIKTKNSQKYSGLLPDKSMVILNSQSKLSFQPVNWKNKRVIHLNGEAFFNVKKGETFNVKTTNGQVEVLGTSFNVYSRAEELDVKCYSGRVKVKGVNTSVILNPFQQSRFIAGEKIIHKELNKASKACWSTGSYYYQNEPLQKVINELERQFDVRIVANINTNRKFTGILKTDDLIKALTFICTPMNVAFQIDYTTKKVTLSEKE